MSDVGDDLEARSQTLGATFGTAALGHSLTFPYLRLQLTVDPRCEQREGFVGRRASDASQNDGSCHPPLPATRLRRALGKALVDLFCPFGRPRCQDWPSLRGAKGPSKAHQLCPQAKHCAYGVFFAAGNSLRPPFALYVLPGRPGRTTQDIEVTLFDESWRLYPWMLAAMVRALEAGVGKRRQHWWLEQVIQLHPDGTQHRLCGDRLSDLATSVQPDTVPLSRAALLEGFETTPCRSLGVHLLSPTRLFHGGRLLSGNTPIPFSILVARTLDRFRSLYGNAAQSLLPQNLEPVLEAEAERVPIVCARTQWVEQVDYSARFRSEIKLGGRVGDLVYGRGAERFLPILRTGEILHVGKNVTSGCGRIEVAG